MCSQFVTYDPGTIAGPATSTLYSPALWADTTGSSLMSPPYAFPTSDGVLNEVLVTNGLGVVEWASVQTPQLGEIDWIDFIPQSPAPAYSEARLFYDRKSASLSFYNDVADMTLNVGEELIVEVKNKTGATIENGKPVKIIGTSGQVLSVALSDLEDESGVFGVATHDIPNNTNGYVTSEGNVGDVDLSAFSEGDVLFLTTTPGVYTNIQPIPPNRLVYAGIVLNNHPVDGVLHVRIGDIEGDVSNNDISVTPDNFPVFSEPTGKVVTDSGISTTDIMLWKGPWASQAYKKNNVVRDNQWLMIANKDTLDRAGPVEIGSASDSMTATPTWVVQSEAAAVGVGSIFTFNKGGWVKSVDVWSPEVGPDITYRITFVNGSDPDDPTMSTIDSPLLSPGEWARIKQDNVLVLPGQVYGVFLEALNSGAALNVTGGWTYSGTDQSDVVCPSNWSRDNQQTIVRVCDVDLDTTNRESELLGAIPGSILTFTQTDDPAKFYQYRIDGSPLEAGASVSYSVTLLDTGGSGPNVGAVTTMSLDIPIPQPTKYVEILNHYPLNNPTWATIEGYKEYDGVAQSGFTQAAYGVRINFQPGAVSLDWDLMSLMGEGLPADKGSSRSNLESRIDALEALLGI